MEGRRGDQIFTIDVNGCSEIDMKGPAHCLVVRISIVDQRSGCLLKKKFEENAEGKQWTRHCFSMNESTGFIPPACTKIISVEQLARLRPTWQDSFLYNCLVESILQPYVVIYFELINMEILPKENSFRPIAWAFLRPKPDNGIININKTSIIQSFLSVFVNI